MMKRILTFVAACLMTACLLSAQEQPCFEKILKQDYCWHVIRSSPQGGAVYGDFLFQFHDHNPAVAVYNLADGTLAGDIKMQQKSTHHCNNVQFSTYFYEKGDEFPLVYASMENKAEHCVLVYRIMRTAGGFEAVLVQTVTLPAPVEMGVWYPNVILDLQNLCMYIGGYSRESWKDPSCGNALQLLRFDMPVPFDGDVTLGCQDIRDRKLMDFRVATQGACIRNGRLYQSFGVPEFGPTSLCCINLETAALEWEFDLPSCGFGKEPEALVFWRDELCVVDVSGAVYRSGLRIPWAISPELAKTAPRFAAGARKKLVCLDLDATLTQHRTPLEKFNRDALQNLCNHFEAVMVCAGNAPRVRRQMGDFPISILGNYGMQEAHDINGELVITKQITLPADTAFFVKKTDYLRKKYGYTEYDGASVEFHASGMVTFGLLGTTAAAEQKVGFDPDRAKRRAMYPEVLKIFKNYSVYIGGSSSFDFAGKEFNKYDAVMRYASERGYGIEDIIFIGDDFGDGGGDSHVRIYGMDYISIDDYHNFPVLTAPLLLNNQQ